MGSFAFEPPAPKGEVASRESSAAQATKTPPSLPFTQSQVTGLPRKETEQEFCKQDACFIESNTNRALNSFARCGTSSEIY